MAFERIDATKLGDLNTSAANKELIAALIDSSAVNAIVFTPHNIKNGFTRQEWVAKRLMLDHNIRARVRTKKIDAMRIAVWIERL